MDEFTWTFKDSSWEQDDSSKVFKIRGIFGQKCEIEPIAPLGLLLGAKSHPASGVPCEKGLFPSEFKSCPYCGSNLFDAHGSYADLWLPPYGAGNGLKLFPIKSTINQKVGACNEKASQFLLPSRDGRFAFCSTKLGAQKRLLVSVQRDSGQLWIFRPGATKKWEVLIGNAGEDTLPAWSWSLAVDSSESGLCLPTDKGPVWVTINWASSSIKVDRALGRSVGGAIRVGKYLLAPVLRGDSFTIACRKEGDTVWSECSQSLIPKLFCHSCAGTPVKMPIWAFPSLTRTSRLHIGLVAAAMFGFSVQILLMV